MGKQKPPIETVEFRAKFKVVDESGAEVRESFKNNTKRKTIIPYKAIFVVSKRHGNWVFSHEYDGWICVEGKNKVHIERISIEDYNAEEDTLVNPYTVVARDVIDGRWGSVFTRKRRLTKAGYDYDRIKEEMKKLLAD